MASPKHGSRQPRRSPQIVQLHLNAPNGAAGASALAQTVSEMETHRDYRKPAQMRPRAMLQWKLHGSAAAR